MKFYIFFFISQKKFAPEEDDAIHSVYSFTDQKLTHGGSQTTPYRVGSGGTVRTCSQDARVDSETETDEEVRPVYLPKLQPRPPLVPVLALNVE